MSSKVLTDPKTGASKCAGFVRFSTPEEAARAMKDMNGKQVTVRMVGRRTSGAICVLF